MREELKARFQGRRIGFIEGDGLTALVYRMGFGKEHDAYTVLEGSWELLYTWEDLLAQEEEDEAEHAIKQESAWCREAGYCD